MEIKYTYRDEDRPIESARFTTEKGTDVTVQITGNDHPGWSEYVAIQIANYPICFRKQDFADFTALVNRINKQINGKEDLV